MRASICSAPVSYTHLRFFDIADIEDGLAGQQLRLPEDALFIGVLRIGQTRGLAVAQQIERLAEHRCGGLGFLVALRRLFRESGNALFQAFEIGKQQLGLDRLGVGDRIDLVFDMLDVVILETAQDVDDRVDFADVA